MIKFSKKLSAVLFLLQLPAWATDVQAPCNASSTNDKLRSCDRVIQKVVNLGGSTGNGSGDEYMAGTIQQVHDNVASQMKTYVQTKTAAGSSANTGGAADDWVKADGSVCNSVENEFAKRNEGEGCNKQTAQIIISPGVTTYNHTGDFGQWEDAVLRGSYVSASSCFYKEVTQKLTVGGVPTIPIHDDCAALASKYNELKSNLLAQPSIEFIKPGNCPDDGELAHLTIDQATHLDNASQTNFGARNQNCNFLRAQRAAVEAMFADVVSCDIVQRAYHAFFNKFAMKNNHLALFKKLNETIDPACHYCANYFDPTDDGSLERVSQCATSCYSGEVKKDLPPIIEKAWPMDLSKPCDTSQSFSMFFAIGSLGFRRRKKKSKSASAAKSFQLRFIFALCLMPLATYLLTACSSGTGSGAQTAQVAHDSPLPGSSFTPSAADLYNQGLTHYNSGTSAGNAALDQNSGAQNRNNLAANTPGNGTTEQNPSGGVNGAFANSPNLLGGSGTVDPFSNNGNTHFSATDGGIKNTGGSGSGGIVTSGSGGGVDPAALLKNNGLTSSKSAAGGASGSGAAQLGAGGPSGTDPSTAGAGGPLDGPGSLKNDALGSAFAAGGGGGAGGRPGGDGSNPFDLGGGGGGAGTGGRLDFNSNGMRSPASANGADRADYLSLIDPKDSIFKVVHRRYEKTTIAWRRETPSKHP